MLSLSRRAGEKIVVADGEIEITIGRVSGEYVRLIFTAGEGYPIAREEVYDGRTWGPGGTLSLTRKVGQSIFIGQKDVIVKVIRVSGRMVKVGIQADRDISILRGELC